MSSLPTITLRSTLRTWWRNTRETHNIVSALRVLARELRDFLLASMPEQKRQRYGDMEYDWDNRVDTTSGTVGWRDRLLGTFLSHYQPTEPGVFHQMMRSLPIAFSEFAFVDLGSGKGRTLLMASEYPFRRVLGVEIVPELNRVALENIRKYKSTRQQCFQIESICADARVFELPEQPLVLYMFNPVPESALREILRKLKSSLARTPRPTWILYHNPLLDAALNEQPWLKRTGGDDQFSLYQHDASKSKMVS